MKNLIIFIVGIVLAGCSDNNENAFKFNGRLEVDIIKVAAKTNGEIDSLFADEGDRVIANQDLAVIEKDRLHIQEQQQTAQLGELEANVRSMQAQVKQLNAQLKLNEDLIIKTKDLVSNGAATTQKLDELTTQNEVLKSQIESVKASIDAMSDKRAQINAAINLTKLNLNDSRIVAPVNGIILNRYRNLKELVGPGSVMFDVADLDEMDATIYVPLADLNRVKLGQSVSVQVDGISEDLNGTVKWISSEAEFTPKTILTDETRTSLVYAVKIRIDNKDGRLKIGMPVDVIIGQDS
ncbi:MAG: efflux RND transporter periplasmic adaptor subunit [Calditrichae bacterium]|nr:efflux RND transporter periplasmic adaptor subunit [Calditrichia bacterium]